MKTSWTKGLKPQQAEEFRREFSTSGVVRLRLAELLKDKISTSNTGLRNKDNYASASWGFLQADGIGYERALLEVISLISTESVEKE